MKRRFLLCLTIVTLSNPQAKADFFRYGIGADATCATWSENRRNELIDRTRENTWLVTWLEGYLTARGKNINKLFFNGVNYDVILQWLDTHCSATPAQRFDDALDFFAADATNTLPPGFELEMPKNTKR